MSAGAPWSVKGIDPKAREIAKDLARRSGMTLGEWLNQMILEDVEEESAARKPVNAGPERRARLRSVEGGLSADAEARDAGLERVTRALEGLAQRIEASELRSSQAIGGVDRAVAGLLGRLETAERGQGAAALKFDRAAQELRADQARLADRLRQVQQEAAGPRSLQALKALEQAMGKLAGQLYEGDARTNEALVAIDRRIDRLDEAAPGEDALIEGLVARIGERLEQAEARTSGAIRALEGSFTHLDERLNHAEIRLDAARETRFEALAEELSRRVDEARAELAVGLDAAVSGRFDRLERALDHLGGHVEAAEKRSAEAIEHMGHEVVRIARNLDSRMVGVERASQRGLAETRGELARIAEAAEQRFRLAETGHAQALERLGQEIGRISQQMTARIVEAEQRAAVTTAESGARLERTAGLLEAQVGKASADLAERIRESEERTARLIEETREKIDRTLTAAAPEPEPKPERTYTPGPGFMAAAPAEALFEPEPEASQARSAWTVEPAPRAVAHAEAAEALFEAAPPPEPAFYIPADAPEPDFYAASETQEPEFYAESEAGEAEWAPAQALSAGAVEDEDAFSAETEFLPHQDGVADDQPILSTRAALEAARNAARSGGARPNREDDRAFGFGLGGLKLGTKTKLSERVAKETKRESSTVKTAALSTAFAMVLTSSVVGYKLILSRQPAWSPSPAKRPTIGTVKILDPEAAPPPRDAQPLADDPSSPDGLAARSTTSADAPPPVAPAAGRTSTSQPLAAVALATAPMPAAKPPAKLAEPTATDLYQQALRKLSAQEPGGLALMTKAANEGYAPAEFHLGKLYENGEAGLVKDPAAARRWTERAAQAGEPRAMHNLALYYFDGVGGSKDLIEAADWFRKAAGAGVVDSQYNLGRLYEQGYGVQRDPAEAYKWYLVAARAGDQESKSAAEQLKASLSAQDLKAAERAAAAIQSPAHEDPARLAGR